MERKKIQHQFEIYIWDFDELTIDEACAKLKGHRDEVLEWYIGNEYQPENFRLSVANVGFDGGIELSLVFDRLEDDDVFEKRIKEEERLAQTAAEHDAATRKSELEEYERLKKKYG